MLSLKSKVFLFPYWMLLKFRHFLYDNNFKKGVKFDAKVICVGNITVGGTGKTPFTEMIIREILKDNGLASRFEIMVLSRGYKRSSKGFKVVEVSDSYVVAGDEPLQIKRKFPNVVVAVCEDRREGIKKLLAEGAVSLSGREPLIILDDAFQHRRVKPERSVVLMNYNRPIFNDDLLPIGRLRDLPEQVKRADDVVVTNSPFYYSDEEYTNDIMAKEFLENEKESWEKSLSLRSGQGLFFAATAYKDAVPLFECADLRYLYSKSAVFFSGIANDTHFKNHISENYKVLDSLIYPDHCSFSKVDVSHINKLALKYPLSVIFTTEKDSVRLLSNSFLSDAVKERLFFVPIETRIISDSELKSFIKSLVE